eukprot:scaffold46095_cov70-Attheya_sp.AAC.3
MLAHLQQMISASDNECLAVNMRLCRSCSQNSDSACFYGTTAGTREIPVPCRAIGHTSFSHVYVPWLACSYERNLVRISCCMQYLRPSSGCLTISKPGLASTNSPKTRRETSSTRVLRIERIS